jgi:hypothetical protein
MSLIPSQLASETPQFLRIAEASKAPKRGNSASDGPFFHHDDSEITRHLGSGGNVARVLQDELVAFDIDSQQLYDIIADRLPDSFEIESGGDGIGFHRYYRVPEFDKNQVEFRDSGTEIGGLRSGNAYCLIPPSRHDETGNQYSISKDTEIAYLPADIVENIISDIREKVSQHVGGAAAAAAPRVGSPIPEIPQNYPEKSATWNQSKRWLASNGLLDRFDKSSSEDWSGLEFAIAKCLAEGGFEESVISQALDRLHHSAKWHNRDNEYRTRTVRKAIVAACNDEFVSFDTGDMGASEASESRKTESGTGNTGPTGGDNMDYTSKDTLTTYNADSAEEAGDGDRVVRVELTNMKGRDENGETDVDFVTVQKGQLRDNGEFGVSPEFNGDNKSVGSADPDDLRLIAEGLEEMANRIEE